MERKPPQVRVNDVLTYVLTEKEVRRAVIRWMEERKEGSVFLSGARYVDLKVDPYSEDAFMVVTAEFSGDVESLEDYNKRKKADVEEKS